MEMPQHNMYVAKSEIPRIIKGNDDGAGDTDSIQIEGESQTDLEIATSNLTLRPDERSKNMSKLSVDTYQHIEDLCHVLQCQCCASDVKLLLFAAAANSEGYRGTLVPIPPQFMGDTFYDIEQLRQIVAIWPSCHRLLDTLRNTNSTQLDAGYIHLLHWVLIAQANPSLRRFKVNRLPGLCKDYHLGRPASNPKEVLSVSYKDEPLTDKSKQHYAYLGCPLQFLYRLLIMGRMDNNWTGPLRLYDQVEPALAQCTVTTLPLPSNFWSHSRFGRAPRCVLICQVLQEKLMPRQQQQSELIIDDTSCLRFRYLLIFTESNESIEFWPSTSIGNGIATRRRFNSSSFKNNFNGNKERHRSRGSCGSRWIFRLVGWIMGRVVHVVQRQRTF